MLGIPPQICFVPISNIVANKVSVVSLNLKNLHPIQIGVIGNLKNSYTLMLNKVIMSPDNRQRASFQEQRAYMH